MSRQQRGRTYRKTTYEDRQASGRRDPRGEYIHGNTVRKADIQSQMDTPPRKKSAPAVRKNRDRAHHMSMGYVLFLATAMCAAAFILVNYIQLQSDLINMTKYVASKESELNSLKLANDEEYHRIVNSIDLEEIKRVAIGELGMVYAREGQIVPYTNDTNDYMRKATGK